MLFCECVIFCDRGYEGWWCVIARFLGFMVMQHRKDPRVGREPGPVLWSPFRWKPAFFSCSLTSSGWFYILAQTQIIKWGMCKGVWLHQEWVLGKEPCLRWADWQSKYLLKDKLMTLPGKWLQIHYWNEGQYFALILSKNKWKTANTSVYVCVHYTSPRTRYNVYQTTKVEKVWTHFLEICVLNLVLLLWSVDPWCCC